MITIYRTNKINNPMTRQTLSLMLLTFTLWGCSSDDGTPSKMIEIAQNLSQTSLASLLLKQPKSCDDLKKYVVSSIIKRHTTIPHYVYCPGTLGTGGGGPVAAPAAPDTTSAPDDVSDTNNQEAGVNESDIVKADDRGNIYIASGHNLIIAKGFPPQDLTTLKEVKLDGHITDLFLDKVKNRVIVISRYEEPYILDPSNPTPVAGVAFAPTPIQGSTDILFLDVTTPATPTVIKQLRLKGYFQTGRRIDDRLHLILRHYSDYNSIMNSEFWALSNNFNQTVQKLICDSGETEPSVIANNPDVIAIKESLTSNITKTFDVITMEDYIPTAQQSDGNSDLAQVPFLACTDVQHPKISSNLNLQYISSIDTDGANMSATAMINNSWQTYVSKNNIYVSETSRNWWWDTQDDTIPSSQTAIYKFAISKQKPVYAATGSIEGYARNQFSFSEFNGDLRVATTQDDWFSETNDQGELFRRRELSNNVFVMRDNGNRTLETIGEVRGFGKDEDIRSSRFLGNRAFVVTFRSIDPLFTFDLSVPETPKLMGELSIPGFSSYMHPYDDNHLVTIGRAGGNGGTGVGNGIQLQLFRVSDLTNPTLVHSMTPNVPTGWSWSSAEYDHKAFTFYKPENLLAIPLQFSGSNTTTGFSGIYTFNVSIDTGFTELGKVDHADLALEYYCNNTMADLPNYQYDCKDGGYVRWAAPRRSIVMTDSSNVYLYTISDVGIKAGNITDLTTTLGSILFPEQAYPWWYTIGRPIVTVN